MESPVGKEALATHCLHKPEKWIKSESIYEKEFLIKTWI